MQEIVKAQNNLKQLLEIQTEELKQLSEKVADGFIKTKVVADGHSKISDSVVHDLNHQISVLENIRRSGAVMEQSMIGQVQGYIKEYTKLRDQILGNNLEVQMKVEEKLNEKGQDIKGNQKIVKKERDNLTVGEDFLQSLSEEHPFGSSQNLFNLPIPKQNTNSINKKFLNFKPSISCQQIKKISLMGFEHLNSALFLLLFLYLFYVNFFRDVKENRF